jgi:Tol biopolymer transport system component
MALIAGTRMGPYEVVSALGAGGMGEVYRAKDTRLGREVAIKVLPADVAADPERLQRFEREGRAVSALNHPNIVTLYEVGSGDSGPYLVLEKIDGRSLRELLAEGPIPVRRILSLATQIAEGLAKAHAAGIVHRDLKPDNIMVTSDGFAKILDFGLAKLVWPELGAGATEVATTLAGDTASGMILGTLGYLSPEQAAGKPADYRADQFALGALIYEMAARERPFRRATVLESLAATISDEPDPVRARRPDLPAPLEWLIERCLSKDPADRYASSSDLARDLASLRDHLSDLMKVPAAGVTAAGARVLPRGWVRWAVALAAAAGIATASFIAGKQTTGTQLLPSYRPLTFQRGTITGARFSPDGKTVYYSAAYGEEPSRVFVTHLERSESKPLDVPPGFLLGVSSKNELALLLTNERASYAARGTLARVPAVGGTPRHLVDDALYADWAPDGERLAVGRANALCEFPIGRHFAKGCTMPRVSPQSDHIAFLTGVPTGVRLEIQRLDGGHVAADDMVQVFGHAWSPDGREVWFTASETGSAHDRALYALSLNGSRRLIARIPGAMSVYDVAPDGRSALVATGAGWFSINAGTTDGSREQSLDLLGRSEIVGLSSDGKWLLLNETREVGTGSYLRSTDGERTLQLSGDTARGLSPDGTRALVAPRGNVSRLTLLPTGAGDPRDLAVPSGFELPPFEFAKWSKDGRRLFMWLRPAGQAGPFGQLHAYDDEHGWQLITPVLPATPFAVSPDAQAIAVRDESGVVAIYSIDGGAPRRLEGERRRPIHWSADGRELLLLGDELYPARIYRRDLQSGHVELWRTIAPADPTGVMLIGRVLFSADGRTYVYQYSRGLNDLYLARDLPGR